MIINAYFYGMQMKRIGVVLLAAAGIVAALTVSSCEREPGVGGDVPVVGIWECITADYGGMSEDAVGVIGKSDKISLLENGSFYIDSKKFKQNGTWHRDGDKLALFSPDTNKTYTYIITELTQAKLCCYVYINGRILRFSFARI